MRRQGYIQGLFTDLAAFDGVIWDQETIEPEVAECMNERERQWVNRDVRNSGRLLRQ